MMPTLLMRAWQILCTSKVTRGNDIDYVPRRLLHVLRVMLLCSAARNKKRRHVRLQRYLMTLRHCLDSPFECNPFPPQYKHGEEEDSACQCIISLYESRCGLAERTKHCESSGLFGPFPRFHRRRQYVEKSNTST